MKTLPDASIDMVLTDPPYGTTACKWDIEIALEPLWDELMRVTKDDSALCLFGGFPFGATIVAAKAKFFRHDWVWQKSRPGNFVCAKYQPMRDHESILVFSKRKARYFPIKEPRKGSGGARIMAGYNPSKGSQTRGTVRSVCTTGGQALRYPSSIQAFNNIEAGPRLHPTQKPVALLEYLIKTYTVEGDTVLDFAMGSGSTGVACAKTRRKFIGIEKDDKYFKIAEGRLRDVRDGERCAMDTERNRSLSFSLKSGDV